MVESVRLASRVRLVSLPARCLRALGRHRGLLLVSFAALAVRLYWNLKVHNPLDFIYSDMNGYLGRADGMLGGPHTWKPNPWDSLFPYGTHIFLYVLRRVFGKENHYAIAVAYALAGTVAVAFTYAAARRYTKRPWVTAAIGLLLVVYYPWISMGGYALSEIPFTACLSGALFFSLRLADRGRNADAWMLGLVLGVGACVRSQILISVVLLALLWLVRLRQFPNVMRGHIVRIALPLGLFLAISSVRLHWHTGMIGLVSTNGPLNFALGRCHSTTIEAHTKDANGFFGPPPFYALEGFQKEHPKGLVPITPTMGPTTAAAVRLLNRAEGVFRLDPAFGNVTKFTGHMWEPKPIYEAARKCIEKTGYVRQLKYALTHAVLLWGYNFPWPDQGQKVPFRTLMLVWNDANGIALLPPALVGMVTAFRRRRVRTMLIALHVWAVILTAAVYFGDARLRTPYDGALIVLALESYRAAIRGLRHRWRAWRRGPLAPGPRLSAAPVVSAAVVHVAGASRLP